MKYELTYGDTTTEISDNLEEEISPSAICICGEYKRPSQKICNGCKKLATQKLVDFINTLSSEELDYLDGEVDGEYLSEFAKRGVK